MQGRQHWSVRGVLWLWLLNDERELHGCALICDLQVLNSESRYTNCELCFANEICPGNDVRTAWRGWKWDPTMRSKWSLRACEGVFETKNQVWCGQSAPKVDLRSSDQAFWSPFSRNVRRFCRLRLHQQMKSVSDVFFASNLDQIF